MLKSQSTPLPTPLAAPTPIAADGAPLPPLPRRSESRRKSTPVPPKPVEKDAEVKASEPVKDALLFDHNESEEAKAAAQSADVSATSTPVAAEELKPAAESSSTESSEDKDDVPPIVESESETPKPENAADSPVQDTLASVTPVPDTAAPVAPVQDTVAPVPPPIPRRAVGRSLAQGGSRPATPTSPKKPDTEETKEEKVDSEEKPEGLEEVKEVKPEAVAVETSQVEEKADVVSNAEESEGDDEFKDATEVISPGDDRAPTPTPTSPRVKAPASNADSASIISDRSASSQLIDKNKGGVDPGLYISSRTWEERTWKELVRLREEMWWARVGGVIGSSS